jgi:tetratricopeptide (TPR) repeat protein
VFYRQNSSVRGDRQRQTTRKSQTKKTSNGTKNMSFSPSMRSLLSPGRNISPSLRRSKEDEDKTSFYIGSGLVVDALQSYSKGDYDAALKSLGTALKTQQLTLGDVDVCTSHTLGNIGAVYLKMGPDWSTDAIKVLEEALNIKMMLKSETHNSKLPKECKNIILYDTLNNLGSAYVLAGDYIQAMACFQDALKELTTSGTESINSEDIANTLYNIGNVHCLVGEYDDALFAHMESLEIIQSTFGEADAQAAEILEKIGTIYMVKEDVDQAMAAFLEALSITKATLGSEYIDCVPSLYNLAHVHELKGEKEAAMEALMTALNIYQKNLNKKKPVAEGMKEKIQQKMTDLKNG